MSLDTIKMLNLGPGTTHPNTSADHEDLLNGNSFLLIHGGDSVDQALSRMLYKCADQRKYGGQVDMLSSSSGSSGHALMVTALQSMMRPLEIGLVQEHPTDF